MRGMNLVCSRIRTYVTCLILLGFGVSSLRAEAYKEPHTGIEFPDALDGFKREKVTPYQAEPGKAGVAIAYHSKDGEITVFVRNGSDESRRTSADYLKGSLAAVKALESQGQYTNVQIREFSADKEKPGWKSAVFTSGSTNRFIVSIIHCKVTPGPWVKIRATTGNPKYDDLQSAAKNLQESVDKALEKSGIDAGIPPNGSQPGYSSTNAADTTRSRR